MTEMCISWFRTATFLWVFLLQFQNTRALDTSLYLSDFRTTCLIGGDNKCGAAWTSDSAYGGMTVDLYYIPSSGSPYKLKNLCSLAAGICSWTPSTSYSWDLNTGSYYYEFTSEYLDSRWTLTGNRLITMVHLSLSGYSTPNAKSKLSDDPKYWLFWSNSTSVMSPIRVRCRLKTGTYTSSSDLIVHDSGLITNTNEYAISVTSGFSTASTRAVGYGYYYAEIIYSITSRAGTWTWTTNTVQIYELAPESTSTPTNRPPTVSPSSSFVIYLSSNPLTIHWSGAPTGIDRSVLVTLIYSSTGEQVTFYGTIDGLSGTETLDSSIETKLPEGSYYLKVTYTVNGGTKQTIQTNTVTITHAQSSTSSSNNAIIIGAAAGGALIITVIVIAICVRRRRSRRVSVSMDPSMAAKGMSHLPSSKLVAITIPPHYQKQQDVEMVPKVVSV